LEGSRFVAALFTPYFVRLVFPFESAPEFARNLPVAFNGLPRSAG
jgi:hypothetical protein